MSRRDELVGGAGRKIAFRELPSSHQLALVYWMSVDGEAWAPLFDIGAQGRAAVFASLQASLPAYVQQYGDTQWTVANLPTTHVQAAVMADPEIAESHETWADYAAWYAGASDVPEHGEENRWPVLLADDDEETLVDGWHRLHSYARAGHSTIPCIY